MVQKQSFRNAGKSSASLATWAVGRHRSCPAPAAALMFGHMSCWTPQVLSGTGCGADVRAHELLDATGLAQHRLRRWCSTARYARPALQKQTPRYTRQLHGDRRNRCPQPIHTWWSRGTSSGRFERRVLHQWHTWEVGGIFVRPLNGVVIRWRRVVCCQPARRRCSSPRSRCQGFKRLSLTRLPQIVEKHGKERSNACQKYFETAVYCFSLGQNCGIQEPLVSKRSFQQSSRDMSNPADVSKLSIRRCRDKITNFFGG